MRRSAKYFTAAVCLFSGADPALASDLVIPEPDAIYDAADYGGFYVGATLGGHRVDMVAPSIGSISGNAALGGVFSGYEASLGGFVVGAEADIEASAFNRTAACANPAWTCNGYLNGLGSIRARFGYAVDSLLFYGTAGVAFANIGGSTSSGGATFPAQQFRTGWTVGAGAQLAFDDNWFGRIEYRYSDFGSADVQFDVLYPAVRVTSQAVRVGVGYQF